MPTDDFGGRAAAEIEQHVGHKPEVDGYERGDDGPQFSGHGRVLCGWTGRMVASVTLAADASGRHDVALESGGGEGGVLLCFDGGESFVDVEEADQ